MGLAGLASCGQGGFLQRFPREGGVVLLPRNCTFCSQIVVPSLS
uniref:Uncharacterized protein n=1 Tax=Anguilla anguilla TaxID=7936 RepID=A0A0E9WJA9_ANGAN